MSEFEKLSAKQASEIHFSLTRGEWNTANYLLDLYFEWVKSEEGEQYWAEFSYALEEIADKFGEPTNLLPFRLAFKLQDLKEKLNKIMCEESERVEKETSRHVMPTLAEWKEMNPKVEKAELGESYLNRAKDRLISHLMDELSKVNHNKITKIDEEVKISHNLMIDGWN